MQKNSFIKCVQKVAGLLGYGKEYSKQYMVLAAYDISEL